MKKTFPAIFTCVILFFTQLHLQAQPELRIDSLLKALGQIEHDTAKIDLYLDLHKAYISPDTSKSLEYLSQAIDLSQLITDNGRLAKSYLNLSNYRWKKGQLDKANLALKNVEDLLPVLNNARIEATYHMEKGLVRYLEGSYEPAVDNFINAMTHYKDLGDTVGYAKCYSNIGMTYWQLEALDEALENYLLAVKLMGNDAQLMGNIGLVYRAKKEYDKALDYYQQSLEITRRDGQHKSTAINLLNIGALYFKLEEYGKALDYYAESHAMSKDIDDQIGVLYADHGIATASARMGDYRQSIAKLQEALDLAVELNVKEEIKNIYFSFADLYEETGNSDKALEYWKKYEIWKDSITSENHLNRVKELELQYQTAEREKEIALLTKENELQEAQVQRQATMKNALIGGIVLAAIIAALIFYSMRQRLKNQKIISAKNEEIKSTQFQQQLGELENKALRSQMNPHFIFNCMNSINRMILGGESDNASLYLTKFAKLIRLMLENSEKPTVSLDNELAMLESYIQLEALTNKGKISYKITVDPELDLESIHIPSMVLQPFIENAIWHGLMHKKDEKGHIKINIKEEEDLLKCAIEDNGIGREKALELKKSAVLKNKSMGVSITNKRLQLLNQKELREMIRFTDLKDPSDQPTGTRVDVLIPIS